MRNLNLTDVYLITFRGVAKMKKQSLDVNYQNNASHFILTTDRPILIKIENDIENVVKVGSFEFN